MWDGGARRCGLCRKGAGLVTVKRAGDAAGVRVPLGNVFIARMEVLHEYVAAGKNVLLSDIDAVWLNDPHGAVLAANADIVAQRGSYPKPLAARWGATLCMGLAYFRAKPKVVRFVEAALERARAAGDDQEAVNEVLSRDVVWEQRLAFQDSTEVDYGVTTAGLWVGLLPHDRFPRVCSAAGAPSGAVVAHCFDRGVLKTDAADRAARAKARGLWALRDDWREVPAAGGLAQYLGNVRRVAARSGSS
eukprot:TRINITY_DN2614_c0_g1_i1.p1 TRINITY_DN2614_c0_g1~~TRINITY_DN2614_c0_g1_i1.p1  ORF type:complete len:247 (+),score=61.50 TRINITY_DN2614_c0_g1_i1:646-1386(+)